MFTESPSIFSPFLSDYLVCASSLFCSGEWPISASKRDRTDVTFLPRKRLSAHYNGDGIEAFGWLASRNAVIGGDERQRDRGPAHGAKSATD
jgi:hypothetical protein